MVNAIGEVPSDSNTAVPKKIVKIVDCGLNTLERKYSLTPEQAKSNHDIH